MVTRCQLFNKVAGENPSSFTSSDSSILITSQRNAPSLFAGKSVFANLSTSGIGGIIFPKFNSTSMFGGVNNNGGVTVVVNKFNPFIWLHDSLATEFISQWSDDTAASNITTTGVVSVIVTDANGRTVNVTEAGLNNSQSTESANSTIGTVSKEDPLYIVILNPTLSPFQGEDKLLAACRFWNYAISNWSYEGCTAYSVNLTTTVCRCTHLTDFGAQLVSAYPRVRLLSKTDFRNLTWQNLRQHPTAAIATFMAVILYLMLIPFALRIDKINKIKYTKARPTMTNSESNPNLNENKQETNRSIELQTLEIYVPQGANQPQQNDADKHDQEIADEQPQQTNEQPQQTNSIHNESPARKSQIHPLKHAFIRNFRHRHIWLSIAIRHPRDRVNSFERLCIVLALVLGNLAVNAIFFGTDNTLSDIATAIVSSICVMICTVILLVLFRGGSCNSKPIPKEDIANPRPIGCCPKSGKYIAWCICALWCAGCIMLALVYGLQFDLQTERIRFSRIGSFAALESNVSARWVVACIISLAQDFFVNRPLLIVVRTLFGYYFGCRFC